VPVDMPNGIDPIQLERKSRKMNERPRKRMGKRRKRRRKNM